MGRLFLASRQKSGGQGIVYNLSPTMLLWLSDSIKDERINNGRKRDKER